MTDLSILVPVLRRPHRVGPLVASISQNTGWGTRTWEIVFIATEGEDDEIRAIEAVMDIHSNVRLLSLPSNPIGDYAKKINHGYSNTDSPLLFLGADDLEFHPRWFQEAGMMMNGLAGTGVVGTQDMANRRVIRKQHSTHSLVTRDYIDRHGTIDESGKVLHEGYVHEFVDDEFVETARRRGMFRFCNRAVVEHLHPTVGKAPTDSMYADSTRRMNQSRALFNQRRSLWR